VALLMAIFALLIISVIGLALVLASGTESSLAANYRTSTQAFYAAESGIEEARGRLSRGSPNTIMPQIAPFPAVLPVNPPQVWYILNPGPGETNATVDPLGPTYPDNEYGTEFSAARTPGPPPAGNVNRINSVSAAAGLPGPLFKWVRITGKTEWSSATDVDGVGGVDNTTTPVFYDGTNQNLTSTGRQVFTLTSLAVMPNGSRRLLHYDVAPLAPIPVDAAIHTLLAMTMGDALNVTGFTDPVCAAPPTDGAISGSTITTPGGGNVTGSPTGVLPNAPFPYNLAALAQALTPQSSPIDSPGTGVTGSGSPPSYSGPHATLGTPPTVTYDASGAITSITAPGAPAIYSSPGDLTLGTPVVGGAPPSGQGILLVNGNLTIDITNGFNYFGAILVTGNITMTTSTSTTPISNIHGAIIGGGKFDASALTNLGGSIFVHQNACMVQNQLDTLPLRVLAFREIPQ
jgi:hypothetical protein